MQLVEMTVLFIWYCYVKSVSKLFQYGIHPHHSWFWTCFSVGLKCLSIIIPISMSTPFALPLIESLNNFCFLRRCGRLQTVPSHPLWSLLDCQICLLIFPTPGVWRLHRKLSHVPISPGNCSITDKRECRGGPNGEKL